MKNDMPCAAIAVAALLAGCASHATRTEANAQSVQKGEVAQAQAERSTILGSRIPRKSTDRTVKSVGNQDYRADNPVKSIANDPAFRSGQ